MKKYWQRYTADAAKQVESKYYKQLVISLIISFILFMIFTCFRNKVTNMLSWCFDGWVIAMFEYVMTSYLCSKKVVFWLSAIISFILMLIIGLLSIVWMVIAGGYIY